MRWIERIKEKIKGTQSAIKNSDANNVLHEEQRRGVGRDISLPVLWFPPARDQQTLLLGPPWNDGSTTLSPATPNPQRLQELTGNVASCYNLSSISSTSGYPSPLLVTAASLPQVRRITLHSSSVWEVGRKDRKASQEHFGQAINTNEAGCLPFLRLLESCSKSRKTHKEKNIRTHTLLSQCLASGCNISASFRTISRQKRGVVAWVLCKAGWVDLPHVAGLTGQVGPRVCGQVAGNYYYA